MNTKLWVPKGLLEVDVKKPEVDVKFTDDMEMYQDRVAVASGLPRAYFEKYSKKKFELCFPTQKEYRKGRLLSIF